MNEIKTHPVADLGYGFIEKKFLPAGKDEYYLRNSQNPPGKKFRHLTTQEIDILVNNKNSSDDWNRIMVSGKFHAGLIRNCKFYGLVRIGSLEPVYHEFHNLRMPVGLYNSTIISSDIGDNVCVDNVNYLSHFILSDNVMLANINELATTDHAKFGNGILKAGEEEPQRVWIEVCNENGGRGIVPFDGMLAGDAYLWSKYRGDRKLMEKFKALTQSHFDSRRGYYGFIGERTVIKNCRIIKDVKIGSDAYIKGANKLKNLTINSDADRPSQIGEGCELVNGLIGYGCRIFYGVKAVRFILAAHSQLKYGARLINSYLGNNSTISCCEVLNSLIFSAHEQHHNNSFLCAALLMGQSNIAAGATIGSNHNSRSADGEIMAKRGFWPGLCVSLKHNSRFASFTMLAKGDYPAELDIQIPFSLVSNDIANNRLLVMPAFWFMYNLYALERNTWKYRDRDKRINKFQRIEYDYLAPDTINEIFDSLRILESLHTDDKQEAIATGWENNHRAVVITKVKKAASIFRELVCMYSVGQLILHIERNRISGFAALKKSLKGKTKRFSWQNVGGQLIPEEKVKKLLTGIREGRMNSWGQVHAFYVTQGKSYDEDKLFHAFASLLEILEISEKDFNEKMFSDLLKKYIRTREWMLEGIKGSREKDHSGHFRKMMYETGEEMDQVVGKFSENSFILAKEKELREIRKSVRNIMECFGA